MTLKRSSAFLFSSSESKASRSRGLILMERAIFISSLSCSLVLDISLRASVTAPPPAVLAFFFHPLLLLHGQLLLLLGSDLLPLGLLLLQALELFLLLDALFSPLVDVLLQLLVELGLLEASLGLGEGLISFLGGVGGGLLLIELVVRHDVWLRK